MWTTEEDKHYAQIANELSYKYEARHLGKGIEGTQHTIHVLQDMNNRVLFVEVSKNAPVYKVVQFVKTLPLGGVSATRVLDIIYLDMVNRYKTRNIPDDAVVTEQNIELLRKGIASDLDLVTFRNLIDFKQKYSEFYSNARA